MLRGRINSIALAALLYPLFVGSTFAQPFQLPTANRALFETNGEEKFFAATAPDKPWTSGSFGCVRDNGWRIHEGLDIRSVQRDKRGEPVDPVMATADGTVVYFNNRSGLSSYGNYVVVRHVIEGLEIDSIYAHLSSVRPELKIGQPVKAGEVVGTMGRTSSVERITKERAHVHFELNLFINDRFAVWYKKTFPTERNDHGDWNGQNLIGIDSRLIFLEQRRLGTNFSLMQFIRGHTQLCRVLVRDTDFPWLKRYPQLIRPNPVAQKEGVAGYEIALDFNALPFELIPRAESEIKSKARLQLLSVNEAEEQKNPARRLIVKQGGRWTLANNGINFLELLVY